MKRRFSTSAGFTIIETVSAIAIFALTLGLISALLLFAYRTQSYTFEQAQAIQEAQRIVDQMTGELREAATGADGSYLLEKASDYELSFYGDIDKDGAIEKVRYFINPAGGTQGTQEQTCVSFTNGGSCSVTFQDFQQGGTGLEWADLEVAAEGDLDHPSNEVVDFTADGEDLDTLCQGVGACGVCAGAYEDTRTFDVTAQAEDDLLQATADASNGVDSGFCSWEDPGHSMKARFILSWEETPLPQTQAIFRKGVTDPANFPPEYLSADESLQQLSEYVVNEGRGVPVFTYYDEDDNLIDFEDPDASIQDITRVHTTLIINVDLERAPDDFSLETDIQLRNLKDNL